MKAIRVSEFGGPEVLKIADVPDLKPDAGQVLVRVKAAGVNPVDAYIRSGLYPRKPNLPYTPGTDAGGVIEANGAGGSWLDRSRPSESTGRWSRCDREPGSAQADGEFHTARPIRRRR